jgi:tetratricopeptide (TPR) repeat protein
MLKYHDHRAIRYEIDEHKAGTLKTVATTFFMSFDRLGPLEKAILRAASFLAPEPIPIAMFEQCPEEVKALMALWCEENGESPVEKSVADAVALLSRFSLVERGDGSFSIHRMERLVLSWKVLKDRVPRWIEATRAALVSYAPNGTAEDPKTWPVWDVLRPHAETLVELGLSDRRVEPSLTLMGALSALYYGKGLYLLDLHLEEKALAIARSTLPPDSADLAHRLLSYGESLHQLGRNVEAEATFKESLAIREETGPDSLGVAVDLNYLALALGAQGRAQESEALQRRALAIYEAHGDDADKGDVAKSLNNLAGLLEEKGWMDEAENLRTRAVLLAENGLGVDNPKTLICVTNLASLLERKGNTKKAEELFSRALNGFETLGKEHPLFLDALTVYANRLRTKGDLTAAEPLLRRVMEANEKIGRTEQPQFAIDLNNHALLLRQLKRLDEGVALLQRAIGIEDRFLPPDHPKRAHRRNNLAIIYMLADRLDEARRVNAEAWSLKAGQHDVTSGRILFARVALCWLRNADASHYLSQLRTILAQPELSCLGGIDRRWEAPDVLDHLRSRLAPEKADLLAAIVAALNEPGKVTDLERFDLWRSTPALPLELAWPDEPETGNRPIPE